MVQVEYANSLIVGLIGTYVFLTSAAYDQSGIIAPAHYQRPNYGVPSTTNRMAFACFGSELDQHKTTTTTTTTSNTQNMALTFF